MIEKLKSLLIATPLIEDVIQLIDHIRPAGKSDKELDLTTKRFESVLAFFHDNPEITGNWASLIQTVLLKHDPGYLYRERSFFGNTNIYNKFWKLLKLKLLPRSIPDREMDVLFDLLFKKDKDYKWVKAIPRELWTDLFELLNLNALFSSNQKVRDQLKKNIIHISYRITALGLDSDILNKLPLLNDQNSPFLIQNRQILELLDVIDAQTNNNWDDEKIRNIFNQLDECRRQIIFLREHKRNYGISMHLTYISQRLIQQIDRVSLLLSILINRNQDLFYKNLSTLFIEMLEYQELKNSIQKLMRESVNLVAFEIVEHTAQKGEKYIAWSTKEYWKFLKKSMLGGFLIAFFAAFKIQLDKLEVAPLTEGLLFGINYAICFVLVYVLGGIIATKQPAMTASSIVQAIDKCSGDSIDSLKNTIIRVSRSQFISFVGNLILAFPMAILITKAFPGITNDLLIDYYKAGILVEELRPFAGGAYFFAAIAGIILSLSGLISGYFDNKVVYSNVPQRIVNHPTLSKRISTMRLERIGDYILKNSGSLAGNISLGLMLGLAGSFGYFTGLPLDIRHVAFSSANLGFIMEYHDFTLNYSLILVLVLGVLGIGFINFIVSFGLTFWVALRSRNVSFRLFKKLISALLFHFFTKPHHFFLPVNLDKSA
jgi:site-specific recombinase